MTASQRRALDELWARYGVDPGEGSLDFDALFGRRAPRLLEIGFGNGESLLAMARAQPENDYLGIEVHRPGVGHLLNGLAEGGIDNVRVISADAVEVLTRMIPPASLDGVFLFFPDPWPKKRHHKRRIVRPAFVVQVAGVLKPGGLFHMATDWEAYADHMLAVMAEAPGFANSAGPDGYAERPAWRVATRFERRGDRLGHVSRDLVFTRRPD